MTIQGNTFATLAAYLEWLETEWHTFEEKLYTLEDYLSLLSQEGNNGNL